MTVLVQAEQKYKSKVFFGLNYHYKLDNLIFINNYQGIKLQKIMIKKANKNNYSNKKIRHSEK